MTEINKCLELIEILYSKIGKISAFGVLFADDLLELDFTVFGKTVKNYRIYFESENKFKIKTI